MENFNVGAVVFALLVGLWLVYAMPRIADRRRVLGEAEQIAAERHSTSARDLTSAARNYSRPRHQGDIMRDSQPILRPADPTSRPRFELPQSEADLGARIIAPAHRMNRVLAMLLVSLVVVTVALVLLAALGVLHVWAPVVSCVALLGYIGVLRLTKGMRSRKASAASARTARTEQQPVVAVDNVSQDEAPAEVRETRGVKNPAERHEAFLRHVLDVREQGRGAAQAQAEHSGQATFRYGALSHQKVLEDAQLEEHEAVAETHAQFLGSERQVIGSGLTIDEILERRRA